MNEMESIRIEEELQKQKFTQNNMNFNRHSKDSGVVDIDLLKATDPGVHRLSAPECGHGLKNKTLSNSLLDLAEGGGQRRGSGGSLDSGMVSVRRLVARATSFSRKGSLQSSLQCRLVTADMLPSSNRKYAAMASSSKLPLSA